MASKRDYYEVLGVAKETNPEDLKRAYRTLAMKHHPDRNGGDETAAASFKEAAEAYDVLSNPEKRARYDRYGHAGLEGMAMPDFGNGASIFDMFSDILGGIFGDRGRRGPQQGAGLLYTLEITLAEAYRGCTKTVSYPREEICGDCRGSGARPGSRPSPCRHCGGRGQVVMSQGFFRIQQTCPGCGGRGEIITELCGTCKGRGRVQVKRTLQVNVPAGVDNGDRQIPPLQGEGNAGEQGAPRGDLHFDVRIKEHQLFRREGDHLICQVPISFSQAALGGPIEVPTLDGPIMYELKAGHQSHERIHIAGKGMPNRRSGRRGELVAFLLVETPRQLTKRQEELLRELAEIDKKNVSPERKSFFDKIRGLFTNENAEAAAETKKSSLPLAAQEEEPPVSDAKTAAEQPQTTTNGQNINDNLDELRKKAGERDQFLDLAQRTRAEFENYQKRNSRERDEERKFLAGEFVRDILPVLDNLERANAAAKQAGEKGPLVQGVGLVQQQFLDLLKRYGVTRIEAEGKPFDANRHQAIVQQPTADKPADTVLQVVEQGYMMHERVLRPAKVVVAQAIA